MTDERDRFDKLLKAMADGEAPKGRKVEPVSKAVQHKPVEKPNEQ